jgi:Coenzyme PQQ synthesis protein D (PqqD)
MALASLVIVDRSLVGPPSTTVREAEIDGAISVYDKQTRNVVVLNATASDVWRLADGQHTVADIVRLLASAYSVAEATIREDVERTVSELHAAGLFGHGERAPGQ